MPRHHLETRETIPYTPSTRHPAQPFHPYFPRSQCCWIAYAAAQAHHGPYTRPSRIRFPTVALVVAVERLSTEIPSDTRGQMAAPRDTGKRQRDGDTTETEIKIKNRHSHAD